MLRYEKGSGRPEEAESSNPSESMTSKPDSLSGLTKELIQRYHRWPLTRLMREAMAAGLEIKPPYSREGLIAALGGHVESLARQPKPEDGLSPGERLEVMARMKKKLAKSQDYPICVCGCGRRVKTRGKTYIAGHHIGVVSKVTKFLDGDLLDPPDVVLAKAREYFPNLEAELARPKADRLEDESKIPELLRRHREGELWVHLAADYGLSHKAVRRILVTPTRGLPHARRTDTKL